MHSFPIQWITESKSTNSEVIQLARQSSKPALVLVADHQTEGRGQFGRKWLSQPKENLLFSIYFEPQIKPNDAPQLTQVICQAVIETFKEYQIPCTIKLPNDVLVNGKKICGILTESSSRGEKLDYVVIGVGLNVNSSQASLIPQATSMQLETQKAYDRAEVLDKILTNFQKHLSRTPGVRRGFTKSSDE